MFGFARLGEKLIFGGQLLRLLQLLGEPPVGHWASFGKGIKAEEVRRIERWVVLTI